MTKFWAIRFQPTALGQMPSICPRKSSDSLRTTDERNSRPLVAHSASVLAAGEAGEGAALLMPVPAAQVMGVIWMASMYLNRPGRGKRKRRRHCAGEGKQAHAYSRCQNCRAHDDLPIRAIQLTSFLQQGQGGRMTTQLGTLHPLLGCPNDAWSSLADALIRTSPALDAPKSSSKASAAHLGKEPARCRPAHAERPGQGLPAFCS